MSKQPRGKYFLNSSKTVINGNTYKIMLDGKKVMLPLKHKAVVKYSRLSHTKDVEIVSKMVTEHIKNISSYNISDNRLETMVQWHDVGHCPYGHAGEELLNQLISENDEFYYDSFFSGYKHNLLSAKILLDEQKNISWDIIDGVIKHSSTLTKNFNISQVKEYNLLKLNYIFRCSKTQNNNKSWYHFIRNFYLNFACDSCDIKKYSLNKSENHQLKNSKISLCDREKKACFCCVCKENEGDVNKNIARYLLYPYSLTFEGEILRISDEISGLTKDLYYYFEYVSKTAEEKRHIIRSKILNTVEILKAKFDDESICNFLNCFYSVIYNAEDKNLQMEKITKYLISKIVVSGDITEIETKTGKPHNDIRAYVSIANGRCKPLISFDSETDSIFNTLKSSIYGIIHNDKIIKKDNDKGEKLLKRAFKKYYKNPKLFFGIPENRDIADDLSKLTPSIEKMKGNICNKIKHSKVYFNDSDDASKLLNAYRREIAFYIARLSEEDLFKL